ncbi:unnamed protein product [Ectocarpus sp. 12 AP-2014]
MRTLMNSLRLVNVINIESQVMPVGPISDNNMTAKKCLGICSDMDESYTHFGTQYGIECFCTGSLGGTQTSTACDHECAGKSDEICGGFDAMTLYKITSVTPLPE